MLRQGKLVATCDPRNETAASLARMMVGADIGILGLARPVDESGPVRLEVKSLSLSAEDLHGVALKDVSLAVKAGEIVAIAGVAGNGQSELFAALSGERLVGDAAAVKIDGKAVGRLGITARRRLGAAFVPENGSAMPRCRACRYLATALLTGHATEGLVAYGLVDMGKAAEQADRISRVFGVRKGQARSGGGALSGGNLQKFVVGREMLREPHLLIINQPTWGVDAGAATRIHQALFDLARRGSAVVMISQDLDEIFEIADRISVIHDGRLSVAGAGAIDGHGEDRPPDGRRRPCALSSKGAPSARTTMALVSPLIAIALTVATAAIIFGLYGKPPGEALYVYFIKPLTGFRTAQELIVRATPLVLMGVGLALCYISNNWNIGAEGQYMIGAMVGGGIALCSGPDAVLRRAAHPRRRHGRGGRMGPDPGCSRRTSTPTRSWSA